MNEARVCEPGNDGGVFLPMFGQSEQKQDKGIRAAIYLVFLLYLFCAVNVASDYFMSAVEVITSRRIRVKCKIRDRYITKDLWNETIANLTLLALGSSAPEILLASIETASANFYSGALGPGTIVGSAAFNLFVILGVCVFSIPPDETRKIKAMPVYHVTAMFSLFAYFWLFAIVSVITPDVIDIWEAIVTLAMFGVLVVVSYFADIGKLNFLALEATTPEATTPEEPRRDRESVKILVPQPPAALGSPCQSRRSTPQSMDTNMSLNRRARMSMSSAVPAQHPRIQGLAKSIRHSANIHHRMDGKPDMKTNTNASHHSKDMKTNTNASHHSKELFGDPAGFCADGSIHFQGERVASSAGVISFRTDVHTFPQAVETNHVLDFEVCRYGSCSGIVTLKYSTLALNAVEDWDYECSTGKLMFEHGCNSLVVSVRIIGKKRPTMPKSFQLVLEELSPGAVFNPNHDGDCEAEIFTITLESDSKAICLVDRLFNREQLQKARACYTNQIFDAFKVVEDDEEDDEEDKEGKDAGSKEDEQDKQPSAMDYLMHVLMLPWKLLFAVLSPPGNLAGGWILFVASLCAIGMVTAFVGDLASLFGCCAGIADEITAITIVALGTSLPDMFASISAARHDATADAAIVNVTGSNSVNVFLGIGLPWTVASLYWKGAGATEEWKTKYPEIAKKHSDAVFVVKGGSLGFSVAIFCSCAVCAIIILRARRLQFGAELGGPLNAKSVSCLLMVFLWFTYVGLSIVQSELSGDGNGIRAVVMAIATGVFFVMIALQVHHTFFKKKPKPGEINKISPAAADTWKRVPQVAENALLAIAEDTDGEKGFPREDLPEGGDKCLKEDKRQTAESQRGFTQEGNGNVEKVAVQATITTPKTISEPEVKPFADEQGNGKLETAVVQEGDADAMSGDASGASSAIEESKELNKKTEKTEKKKKKKKMEGGNTTKSGSGSSEVSKRTHNSAGSGVEEKKEKKKSKKDKKEKKQKNSTEPK